ncbi:MAG: hypothetical protein HKN04_10315 [Rhodothermaceae bacterium]|nr:hypothetical protein [Rhodothermaceae bacterium]
MTDALLITLADESETLARLATAAADQLAALGRGAMGDFEDASVATAEAVADLGRLEQRRTRQHRMLARTLDMDDDAPIEVLVGRLPADEASRLRSARDRVRAAAGLADSHCDALAFSLHYAVQLGRETLSAWRGLGADRPAHVYTAAGMTAAPTDARPLFNNAG